MPLLRPNDQDPVGVHFAWMHFIVLIWGFTGGILDRLLALTGWEVEWDKERILPVS